MYVVLEKDGKRRKQKAGFSWTALFFNVLVPLFRMDLVGFAIFLAAEIFLFPLTAGIGSIACWLFFPVFYNNWHISRLENAGWNRVRS